MVILTLSKGDKVPAREKCESDAANFLNVCFAKTQGYCYATILADKTAKLPKLLACIPLKTTAALWYLADRTIGDLLIQMYLN